MAVCSLNSIFLCTIFFLQIGLEAQPSCCPDSCSGLLSMGTSFLSTVGEQEGCLPPTCPRNVFFAFCLSCPFLGTPKLGSKAMTH